jgi:hypothetical protein
MLYLCCPLWVAGFWRGWLPIRKIEAEEEQEQEEKKEVLGINLYVLYVVY